jgi:L-threonylcarbamoyladenylate synthase
VTRILPATGAPDPVVVAEAAGVLRAGDLLVLPTDTVYGLACDPAVDGATARLFAAKGRGGSVPVAVLCAHAGQALALADPDRVAGDVRRLAERLWPGPLTLVLPRRPGLGYALGEPVATVGVRCPDDPWVRALATAVGPLATSSANRHGEPTPPTAAGVADHFGADVALVLDGGTRSAPPSSVVDATGPHWRVLREGPLTLDDLAVAARP